MLTIGEFSKICHVTTRTLRHYGALKLLEPVYIDEQNGYRYYESSQLKTVLIIEKLKAYGFSLTEINESMNFDEGRLRNLIHAKMLSKYNELNKLSKTIKQMKEEIFKLERGVFMNEKYEIKVMTYPAQRVFGIKKIINIGQIGDLFNELEATIEKKKIKRSGVSQILYHGEEFSYESIEAEAQYEVTGGNKEIPEQLYVSTTHVGSYDGLKNAYNVITNWFSDHPEYRITGASIERYINDVDMASKPEELETAILFPVEKKKQG